MNDKASHSRTFGSSFSSLCRRLVDWVKFATACLAALTVTGYAGEFHHLFELTSHFRFQYLFFSVAALIVFVLAKSPGWIVPALLCGVINGVEIAPWYMPVGGGDTQQTNRITHIRLLLFNVHAGNSAHSSLVRYVRESDADIVVLIEVDRTLATGLSELHQDYPHRTLAPRSDNFGIALLSRLPFARSDVVFLADTGIPSIHTEVISAGRTLSVVATHPPPPINESLYLLRNRQLAALSEFLQTLNGPTIVAGDLNITMWSPQYREFIEQSGLNNSRLGFGIVPTWPATLPLLMIPIDHVLHSHGVSTGLIQRGDNIGSDHYPLLVELAIELD